MPDIHPRLRAVWDLSVAEVREYAGRHEYDGRIQDLSSDGVRAGLRGLADRVETLGGALAVTSAPGRGTCVIAVIPDGAGPA